MKAVVVIANVKSSSIVYSFLILFLAALFLRLPVLDWGGTTPDEAPATAAKVLTGQLSLDQQYYPPFLAYLTAVAYAFYYAVGRLLRWWASTAEFRAAYFESVTQFYVLGRFVVAALSSAAAPLVFLLAIELGIRARVAFVLGAVAALLPASVFWSQIAKSDSALGPAFLLVLLMAFRFRMEPIRVSRQTAFAAAIAVALSFKQSAAFFLLPVLLILFIATLLSQNRKLAVIRAWLSVALVAVLVWIPLNIGILLNVRGFIDAQLVQSQMSLRNSLLRESLRAWFGTITSVDAGIPLLVLVIWLCVPIFCLYAVRKPQLRFGLLTMWASVALAMVIILDLAGSRQNSQLLLPYSVVIASTVLLLAGQFIEEPSSKLRIGGGAVLIVMTGLFSVESAFIVRQAMAEPVAREVAAAISRFAPPGSRLLSDVNLSHYLPVSSTGAAETRARDERLAEKYSVVLPPVAEERLRRAQGGYIIRSYPFVIGGLERVAGEDMKVILPFAWPLQPEEWTLDYWLAQDYRIFVFQESMLHHEETAYRDFFSSVDRRCTQLAKIPTKKPLILEDTMMIYRCS
jgi:4-amino-4-deoxy-L-arabinose transferase-like glycosyltransferase